MCYIVGDESPDLLPTPFLAIYVPSRPEFGLEKGIHELLVHPLIAFRL